MDVSLDICDENMYWGDEESQIDQATNEIKSTSDNIRVAVKIRPPNKRELTGSGGAICVSVPGTLPEEGHVSVMGEDFNASGSRPSKDFTFDYAFSIDSKPLEVFTSLGVDLVQCAFHGYNASMFAYGQTSSGKSYSMMGIYGTDQVGLIPRIARLLFQAIKSKSKERASVVEASYMEIYNEKLRDLISEKKTGEVLRVRENIQLGVHVLGLTREPVASAEDVLGVIEYGTNRRTTAATLYNSESSRSHAIFEMKIQSKYNDPITKKEMHSSSRIALIDLAGSERSEKVHSKGITLVEGNNINKSLTVLGRCIRALYDQTKGKKVNVPFRDSLLTWYLRDTLAGNSRTTMLATCSPVESNIEETLSTLRYASSAKFIKTSAKKNEDPAQAKIRELSIEVDMLKKKLKAAEELREADEKNDSSTTSSLSSSESGRGGKGRGKGGRAGGRGQGDVVGGRGGKGKLVTNRRGSTMTISERENLLNELTREMGNLSHLSTSPGSDKNSTAKTTVVHRVPRPAPKSSEARKRIITTFPVLSCVSKDELLNHTLKVRIGTIRPFTIGRKISSVHEKNLKKNHFELNGMGIKTRHCEFIETKRDIADNGTAESSPSIGLRTLTHDALVYVNGIPIKENETIKLKHLDRIVLGPCRLVALFITKPLTPKERELWQYEFCLEEMSHLNSESHSESENEEQDERGHISPARKLINQQIKEIKAEQLAQANLIALEMSSPFRFKCELVVRGTLGMNKKSKFCSIDDFLELNKPRLYISCYVENYQLIKHANEVKDNKDFDLIAINQFDNLDNLASIEDNEEDNEMLFDPINESIVSSSTLSGKFDSDKYSNKSEHMKDLFEIPLHEFEDLLAELKYIHSFYSKLSNGLHELNNHQDNITNTDDMVVGTISNTDDDVKDDRVHMIKNLFNSHDVSKTGKISMYEVEETILMFDRYPWFDKDKDPKSFIKYVCLKESISMTDGGNDEANQVKDTIDFNQFTSILNLFLQFQFNNVLKPYVTDKYVFIKFGGVIQDNTSTGSTDSDSVSLYEMEQLKYKYENEISALKEEHSLTLNKVNNLKHMMEVAHDKKVALIN